MPSLEEKLYLSLYDGIAEILLRNMVMRHAPLAQAGALCADKRGLLCADRNGAIWRFDRKTLMVQALGCGGPGICDMCLSPCGTRLYALLGEGDSILMSDACSGRPIALNRCGCNPQNLSCCREIIAVSGGMSGCVHLYSAKTLACLSEISLPGPVYSVALREDVLYALCLTAEMSTLLVIRRGERQRVLHLDGMPGCLLAMPDMLFAATQGRLYVIHADTGQVLGVHSVPGRASRFSAGGGRLFLMDPLSECVYASMDFAAWKKLCGNVRDMYIWPSGAQH